MTKLAVDSLDTFFPRLMPVRQWDLQAAKYAQNALPSAPPLVGAQPTDSGISYRALGATDDAGLPYLLPKLANLLHLSLGEAWTLWFFSILIVSYALGIYAMMRLLTSSLVKAFYLIHLFVVTVMIVMIGDVYALPACLAIAAVPFALRFFTNTMDDRRFRTSLAILFGTGILFGWAHVIRSHAATGLIVFMVALLLFAMQVSWLKRMVLLASLLFGFLVPQSYMKTLFDARDAFLEAQIGYGSALRQHPFWHSIYIGLGFLSNDYGLAYKDEVAEKKVRQVAPHAEYCSPEYEAVLKSAVIDLIKKDPVFVTLTLLAKSGFVLIYFCLFANVGLFAAIRYPKPWRIELAFVLALGFNALFGLLVIPRLSYLLGFIAFAVLYGAVSLDDALRQRAEKAAVQ
ncbi:MAG: hypothetical protein ACK42Y_00720 [Candidatus Thermochlorobacter sp.]